VDYFELLVYCGLTEDRTGGEFFHMTGCAGVGNCMLRHDGKRPATPDCRALTRDPGTEISLAPLPVFKLIAHLAVDTGKWLRGIHWQRELI